MAPLSSKRDTAVAADPLSESVFDGAPIGMAVTTLDGRLLRVNRSLCETTGYEASELVGMSLVDLTHRGDLEAKLEMIQQVVRGERPWGQMEKRLLTRSGDVVHALLKVALLRDAEGSPHRLVAQAIDITGIKRNEEHLERLALYDPLTGLPNRTFINQRIGEMLESGNGAFALLHLDLDRFRLVNDSLGHDAGDALIMEIASRVRLCAQHPHVVARPGGDAFLVLLDGVSDEAAVKRQVERLHRVLRSPVDVGGQDVFCSVGIGVAVGWATYDNAHEVLRDADNAMHRAKVRGRGEHAVFDQTMHRHAVARLRLESNLRRALERDEFRVFYQPVVALPSREVLGFEALIRWSHPERGLLTPGAFLEVAEDTGMVVPIGYSQLRDVCRTLEGWGRRMPERDVYVAVNLSHRQFEQPDLLDQIVKTLLAHRVRPHHIRLEITEDVVMAPGEATLERLERFREMGLKIYVDDFGTGQSSLAHLHRFPIDALKIDREFVQRITPDGGGLAIIEAIMTLARSLGLEVIAEGIEQEHQCRLLAEAGVEMGQGYLFGKPLPELRAAAALGLGPRSV